MTSTNHMGLPTTAPAPGPRAPKFAFPLIDRVVGAQVTRVLGLDALTPTIVRLRLERPAGYEFRASQHALLRLSTNQGPDLRPLSLAGGPDSDHLEFATRAGTSAFKQAMLALRPGDRVKVSRPMGGLAHDSTRAAVLIVGGIGITPVRSLLLAPETSTTQAPVRLLFCNHAAEEIPFADELAALYYQRENLSVTWVLTFPSELALPGPVHGGRLTEELLHQHAAELPDAVFYVTGPATMVSDVHAMLRNIGVRRGQIRSVAQGYR
jgi:ferredoxin-NADP reductase